MNKITTKENNTMKNDTAKTNRYTILDAEVKRISKELKAEKQKMLAGIKDLEAAYRKYRKEVYAPARKAAFDVFKASKVVNAKPKAEKKQTAKKVVVQKKVTGCDKTADQVIADGEKAIAKFKVAAAKNPKAK